MAEPGASNDDQTDFTDNDNHMVGFSIGALLRENLHGDEKMRDLRSWRNELEQLKGSTLAENNLHRKKFLETIHDMYRAKCYQTISDTKEQLLQSVHEAIDALTMQLTAYVDRVAAVEGPATSQEPVSSRTEEREGSETNRAPLAEMESAELNAEIAPAEPGTINVSVSPDGVNTREAANQASAASAAAAEPNALTTPPSIKKRPNLSSSKPGSSRKRTKLGKRTAFCSERSIKRRELQTDEFLYRYKASNPVVLRCDLPSCVSDSYKHFVHFTTGRDNRSTVLGHFEKHGFYTIDGIVERFGYKVEDAVWDKGTLQSGTTEMESPRRARLEEMPSSPLQSRGQQAPHFRAMNGTAPGQETPDAAAGPSRSPQQQQAAAEEFSFRSSSRAQRPSYVHEDFPSEPEDNGSEFGVSSAAR